MVLIGVHDQKLFQASPPVPRSRRSQDSQGWIKRVAYQRLCFKDLLRADSAHCSEPTHGTMEQIKEVGPRDGDQKLEGTPYGLESRISYAMPSKSTSRRGKVVIEG